MRAVFMLCLLAGAAWAQPTDQSRAAAHAAAQMATLGATEEPSVLPEGEGRDEVFYGCTACHGSAVIRRSRLSRMQWDGLLGWMTERHGMNELEGDDRRLVLDYLAKNFGPAQAPARGRNPFLN